MFCCVFWGGEGFYPQGNGQSSLWIILVLPSSANQRERIDSRNFGSLKQNKTNKQKLHSLKTFSFFFFLIFLSKNSVFTVDLFLKILEHNETKHE